MGESPGGSYFGDWLLGMGCCRQHVCVLGRAGECGGSGMHAANILYEKYMLSGLISPLLNKSDWWHDEDIQTHHFPRVARQGRFKNQINERFLQLLSHVTSSFSSFKVPLLEFMVFKFFIWLIILSFGFYLAAN